MSPQLYGPGVKAIFLRDKVGGGLYHVGVNLVEKIIPRDDGGFIVRLVGRLELPVQPEWVAAIVYDESILMRGPEINARRSTGG